jgi:hypothetical protein
VELPYKAIDEHRGGETVSKAIYRKLGVSSRSQPVTWSGKHGLV